MHLYMHINIVYISYSLSENILYTYYLLTIASLYRHWNVSKKGTSLKVPLLPHMYFIFTPNGGVIVEQVYH